jgi:hypothetical protein
VSMSRTAIAVRCCPSHSPTLRPWIDHRTAALLGEWPSYVEELWSRSLAGRSENGRLKHALISEHHFRRDARRVFLSQAGPRFDLYAFQAKHHSLVVASFSPERRRRPVGSPSAELRMRLVS